MYEPFHSEETEVPAGSVNASFQPLTAELPGLLIVYWAEYPLPQSSVDW